MDLTLSDDPGGLVAVVARAALADLGIGVTRRPRQADSAWWQAGVNDAIGRAPTSVGAPRAYDAARSPRRSRGATRA